MCQSGTPLWNIKQETSESSKPSEVSCCVLLRRVLRRRRPLGQAFGVCYNPASVRDKKFFLGRLAPTLTEPVGRGSLCPPTGQAKQAMSTPSGIPLYHARKNLSRQTPEKFFCQGGLLLGDNPSVPFVADFQPAVRHSHDIPRVFQ